MTTAATENTASILVPMAEDAGSEEAAAPTRAKRTYKKKNENVTSSASLATVDEVEPVVVVAAKRARKGDAKEEQPAAPTEVRVLTRAQRAKQTK